MNRARLSKLSKEDREIRERLDIASREIEAAIRIASSVKGSRASRTLRELIALYRGIEDLGTIHAPYEEPPVEPTRARKEAKAKPPERTNA